MEVKNASLQDDDSGPDSQPPKNKSKKDTKHNKDTKHEKNLNSDSLDTSDVEEDLRVFKFSQRCE